jgi:tetratricopeptide (TPR) repeat protein
MDMWTKGSNIFPALKNCLPQSQQGRILFTTRNRILAVKLASPHVLPVAEPDEVTGLKILENSLIDGELLINDNTSIQLLNKLTFLPLAIAQAAAYISENAIKISQYVELLEEQESRVIDLLSEDFEDEGRYETTQNPVATTWWISFQHIQQHNQLAADYLSFMACIDPRDIPHSLLPKAPTRNEGVKAMGLLKAYAFITEQTGDNSLSLHRLVHLATRTWLRKNHRFTKCLYGAAERLDEVFPDDNFTNRKLWQAYISHALAVFKEKGFRNRRERYIGLMQKIAQCLYSDGRYKEAETLFADIVRIQYERHGQNNAATLANMTRLASTYGNLGRWNDAERLEEQVLNTYSEILGPQNPTTLSSLANLASIYQSQGRWIEAKVLQSRVMRMYKKTLGPEHANTLISTHNLALTYNHLGKFHASENLLVKVNGRWMQILGPEHPHTLTSMNSLAFVHQSQRQWKKAEGLFLKVMETRKQILGPHHPHTLTSMHNLASTYQSQEKWKEAEKLLVEVLRTSQLVLGPQHPDTLASMSALVHTLRSRGKESAALSLMNEGIRLSSVTHKGRLINSTGDEQHAAWEEEIEMTRASKIASLNNTTAASSPFFSHERYTIAVVCTLLQEATTVRTMLDEIHLTPVWITDPNIYALGELNGHYVVVVCLSGGVNSTASAATAMSSIHLTFPRLKFAMVVGICGGIPQQANDIRLGDVVVSAPRQSNTIRIAAGLRLFPEAAND